MSDPRSDAALIRKLDEQLIVLGLQGWSIEYRVADQAVLSRRRTGPFWFHFLLTVLTAGIWFVVAVLLALLSEPERCRVWIAEDGRILQREARADAEVRARATSG